MTKEIATKKTYEVFALVCLLPALYIQLKRMNVLGGSNDNDLPAFVSSVRVAAFISLAFSVAAVVFASKSFEQPKIFWRVSSFIVVLVGALLVLLSLFQMI